MALETLKDIREIGDFEIGHYLGIDRHNVDAFRNYIIINHETNTIAFRIQNGPIKEVGVNGCHVDTIIEATKLIIEGLNKNFPCRENALVITKLDEALLWLMKRKLDREKRNVEGESKI